MESIIHPGNGCISLWLSVSQRGQSDREARWGLEESDSEATMSDECDNGDASSLKDSDIIVLLFILTEATLPDSQKKREIYEQLWSHSTESVSHHRHC